jgi:hypothetical protein
MANVDEHHHHSSPAQVGDDTAEQAAARQAAVSAVLVARRALDKVGAAVFSPPKELMMRSPWNQIAGTYVRTVFQNARTYKDVHSHFKRCSSGYNAGLYAAYWDAESDVQRKEDALANLVALSAR